MTDRSTVLSGNLNALHSRMQAQQRALIMQAAEAGVPPSTGALTQISALERGLAAIEPLGPTWFIASSFLKRRL